jgi:hypothetical protein
VNQEKHQDPEQLTHEERGELSRWIVRDGDRIVSEMTGASRSSVVRALAGLDVRRGTVALIRAELRKRRQ